MSILALPTELLELIATHVDAGSLGALRLTSRFFYECTLEVFAERIVNKRWLLRAASLDTLRAAASIPILNERLTTFRLGTHSLASYVERYDENYWRDTWDAELGEQHLLTWRRRESNARMGHGAVILANALNDLQALRKIEIGEWCSAGKDFEIGHGGNEARNGTAQHLNAFYRSASMYTQGVLYDGRPELTILEPLDRNSMRSRLSECFQHVLHALTIMQSVPGAKPLESLSAVLYNGKTRTLHGVLTDEMQKLKEDSSTFKALQPALGHLRELSLAIEVDGRHWVYRKANSKPETWLSVFMKLVPSLVALQLFYDDRYADGQSWAYHQSLWLFFRDTRLQHLARLELACIQVPESSFGEFLDFWNYHAGNLTHLTLTCIQLSSEVSEQDSWPTTLEMMRRMPFKLTYLKLQGLYGQDQNYSRQVVVFSERGGHWGCDECLTNRWRDTSVGSVSVCGHTTYESETGQWPALETLRVCDRYDTSP